MVNRYSGLAIEGFDPVAYFTESTGRPRDCPTSRPREAGAVWRFRNEGNRASFVAHPEIYGPQFGGYDPVDLARGVTYAGNPRFWVVVGPAALSVRPRAEPRCLRRRSGAFPEGGDRALAGAGAGARAVAVRLAPASRCRGIKAPPRGSPQAMNSGTMKSVRPEPKSSAAPSESVILPPAAVTTAWPAATSHSLVGDRRG